MEKHIGKRAEVLLPQDLSVYLLILQGLDSVLRTSCWNASAQAPSESCGVLKSPSIKMPPSWAFSATLSLTCFETLSMYAASSANCSSNWLRLVSGN